MNSLPPLQAVLLRPHCTRATAEHIQIGDVKHILLVSPNWDVLGALEQYLNLKQH